MLLPYRLHRAVVSGPLACSTARYFAASLACQSRSYASLPHHITDVKDHHAIEEKWKAIWAKGPAKPTIPSDGPSRYILAMFPYPSGSLHMGHVRVYTISDALARYHRLQGRRVLHPMGWDAFGLPAENASMDRGIPPATWTQKNIEDMRQQLQGILPSFDWDREVTTCSPLYYRHTQALFLRLHAHGLVYRAEASVNWDPVDQTVLANEQVDSQGRSWRSGAMVEERRLSQWFIKTTSMAKELLEGLDLLGDGWPDRVKQMQSQWLGRSEGAQIHFSLENSNGSSGVSTPLTVYTSRPETLNGVGWLAISPQHPLLESDLIPSERKESLKAFLSRHQRTTQSKQREPSKDGRSQVERRERGAVCSYVHPCEGRDSKRRALAGDHLLMYPENGLVDELRSLDGIVRHPPFKQREGACMGGLLRPRRIWNWSSDGCCSA